MLYSVNLMESIKQTKMVSWGDKFCYLLRDSCALDGEPSMKPASAIE